MHARKSAPGETRSATRSPSSDRRPSSSAAATRSAAAIASRHAVSPRRVARDRAGVVGAREPAGQERRGGHARPVLHAAGSHVIRARSRSRSGRRFIRKPTALHGQRGTYASTDSRSMAATIARQPGLGVDDEGRVLHLLVDLGADVAGVDRARRGSACASGRRGSPRSASRAPPSTRRTPSRSRASRGARSSTRSSRGDRRSAGGRSRRRPRTARAPRRSSSPPSACSRESSRCPPAGPCRCPR